MALPTWGPDQGPACTPSGPAHLKVGQGLGVCPKGLCVLIGFCPLNSFIGRKLDKWQTVEEMSYLNLRASHPETQRVLPHDKQRGQWFLGWLQEKTFTSKENRGHYTWLIPHLWLDPIKTSFVVFFV